MMGATSTGGCPGRPERAARLGLLASTLVASVLFASCATIIGADFSERRRGDGTAAGGDAASDGRDGDDRDASTDAAAPGDSAVDDAAADERANARADGHVPAEADSAEGAPNSRDGGGSDVGTTDVSTADVTVGNDARLDGPRDASDASDATQDGRAGDDVMLEAGTDAPSADGQNGSGDADAAGDALDPRRVVLNELNGTGSVEDFVELYNAGPTPFSLEGYAVAQAQGVNGPPNAGSRLTFTAGITLGAGEHLIVIANQTVRGGPYAPCPVALFSGVPRCYIVDWGISRQGERIYLLAPDLSIVDIADYPPPEAGQVSGKSWGRLPDGTGAFQATGYSPGQANQP